MIYSNHREAYRQAFYVAWQKHLKKLPLDALEAQILRVILDHPQFHVFLSKEKEYEHQEFQLEENPFLHMSLHLAVREQLNTNRPQGIKEIYADLSLKYASNHEAEHHIMESLTAMIAIAQQTGCMPAESEYLLRLKM